MLHSQAGDRGVAVGLNIEQLPVLTLWKNTDTEKQGYVTGMKPGTSYAYNRRYQRDLGLVPTIQPGETRTFDLSYTILGSEQAVQDTSNQISEIQGNQETKVIGEPLVDLSQQCVLASAGLARKPFARPNAEQRNSDTSPTT